MEIATATAAPRAVTILIAGVGGQGVVLAGDVLAAAALLSNLNVKKSESHGLSRRFGSVSCQVRFGRELHSPHRGHGGVDVVLALEGYEALKALPFLSADGIALVNRLWQKPGANAAPVQIPPLRKEGVSSEPENRLPSTESSDPRMGWFDGSNFTHQAECPRSLNFFMLGVLSARLIIPEAAWHQSLTSTGGPRSRDVNREMFAAGRRLGLATTMRHPGWA
jgi:indolepyruvate ferredoxin oxidoreductase beta subunit